MSGARMLSDELRTLLLRSAATAISAVVGGPVGRPVDAQGAMARPGAAFVSIHRDAALRGCMGSIQPKASLVGCVEAMAGVAATRDPRFESVRSEELSSLHLEISVIGPLEGVRSPEDVEIGRHGLLVTQGSHRGVLLAQVAERQGWSAAEFLDRTCAKAGLASGSWRPSLGQAFRFESEVFDGLWVDYFFPAA